MMLTAAFLLALQQRMNDPGFEAVPTGPYAGGVWEVQRTGRDLIQPRLRVAAEEGRARGGAKCLSLSIPKDTVGFEFVTVGQRPVLRADREYEASAWVRWVDGPEQAPAGAGPTSGHPSAIVSFWVRHRDGTGDFAGRDDWLFDGRWTRLSFRFRATDPGLPSLVYVSLLPNQKPADTTILLDDFQLAELDEAASKEVRTGELLMDPGFDAPIGAPWGFANLGGKGIAGEVVVEAGGARHLRLAMGKGTSNYESAQAWQYLELREGVRYEVSLRIRWDNYDAAAPAPIVNLGIFHDPTRTWYGPVDQVLEKTGEWRTYRFVHVPTADGPWKLYLQLNGWGNFGHPLTASFDDVRCVAKP
jgi:hypothetical protein